MIWGSQYDAMLNWMTKTGIIVGNTDDTKRNKETVTGQNEKDVINNIYDLYGCHYEWTIEAHDISHRVRRGGYLGGSNSPASRYDDDSPSNTDSLYSSRATLYIK